MLAYLHHQWIEFFYTSEALFNKILDNDVNGVRSFVGYLKKHDPKKLHKIVNTHHEDGMTLLSQTLSGVITADSCQIAACLLDAGADPHLKMQKTLQDRIVLFNLIKKRFLPGVRLVTWYGPYDYLSQVDPFSGKTVEQLLNDWNQAEPCFAFIERREPFDIRACVETSTQLAQQRFELLKMADSQRLAHNQLGLISTYLQLNKLCQDYAAIERDIPYRFGGPEARQHQIEHYQAHGQRYLHSALQACEDCMVSLGNPTSLNRAELAQYRSVLEQAIALSHKLGETKRQRHYQRLAASLPIIERSPASAELSTRLNAPAVTLLAGMAMTPSSAINEDPQVVLYS